MYDGGKQRRFETFWSPFIRDELRRVWIEKFGLSEPFLTERLRSISAWAQMVEPTETLDVVKESPDDNRILECAVAAHADYLVTGDKAHLLPLGTLRNTRIILPDTFIREVHKVRGG